MCAFSFTYLYQYHLYTPLPPLNQRPTDAASPRAAHAKHTVSTKKKGPQPLDTLAPYWFGLVWFGMGPSPARNGVLSRRFGLRPCTPVI